MQELITVEAHRLTFKNGGYGHWAKPVRQRIQACLYMVIPVDVTAQAQVNGAHSGLLPRSIIKPTSFAPRTAPGLLSRRLSLDTGPFSSTSASPASASDFM